MNDNLESDPGRIGNLIFGSPYKLQLGIWIVHREVGVPFDLFEVIDDLGNLPGIRSGLRNHINAFTRSGLVETIGEVPPPPRQRSRWSRLENPFWEVFASADEALIKLQQLSEI